MVIDNSDGFIVNPNLSKNDIIEYNHIYIYNLSYLNRYLLYIFLHSSMFLYTMSLL